jgi:hypothetical protein
LIQLIHNVDFSFLVVIKRNVQQFILMEVRLKNNIEKGENVLNCFNLMHIVLVLIVHNHGKNGFLQIIVVCLFVLHYVHMCRHPWMLKKGGRLICCFLWCALCMFINIVVCYVRSSCLDNDWFWGFCFGGKDYECWI